MLRELTKVEQRYDAVLAVIRDGPQVRGAAEKLGISRQKLPTYLPSAHLDREAP